MHRVFFYLIFFVDCLFCVLLWVVSTCVLICLVLLMNGFPSLIFDFYLQGFSSLEHFCVKEVSCGERESHKIESQKAFVLEFLSFHVVKKD